MVYVFFTAAFSDYRLRECVIPRTHTFGDEFCGCRSAGVEYSLPSQLRDMNYRQFKWQLKTYDKQREAEAQKNVVSQEHLHPATVNIVFITTPSMIVWFV